MTKPLKYLELKFKARLIRDLVRSEGSWSAAARVLKTDRTQLRRILRRADMAEREWA